MTYSKPIQSLDGIKKTVILRRCTGRVKQANILARAILAYEKSQITISKLWDIYKQLQ